MTILGGGKEGKKISSKAWYLDNQQVIFCFYCLQSNEKERRAVRVGVSVSRRATGERHCRAMTYPSSFKISQCLLIAMAAHVPSTASSRAGHSHNSEAGYTAQHTPRGWNPQLQRKTFLQNLPSKIPHTTPTIEDQLQSSYGNFLPDPLRSSLFPVYY